MRVISPLLVKYEISNLIESARGFINICTKSMEITPVEWYYFFQAIERGVTIDVIAGELPQDTEMRGFAKLYNIRVLVCENLNSRIYQNESSVIITSCNLESLNKPKLLEGGVVFDKKNHLHDYRIVQDHFDGLSKHSKIILPRLPFKPGKSLDYFELLKVLKVGN